LRKEKPCGVCERLSLTAEAAENTENYTFFTSAVSAISAVKKERFQAYGVYINRRHLSLLEIF
jgi:hypothetical protein